MLSWALKFLMAAALAAIVARSEVAPGAVLVAKITVVVGLAPRTVSLGASRRRARGR